MLRRSLAEIIPETVRVLEGCGIDPTARPEDLAPGDFVTIATGVEA
jgi:16S rRNA A1518/A1519 N6-dimethyltransferase RsmA/KsgA/DIM1 with predicted DNA glycosylase/AP lyase activity